MNKVLLILVSVVVGFAVRAQAEFVVHVVDRDTHQPIPGASASVYYSFKNPHNWGDASETYKGVTESDGTVKFKALNCKCKAYFAAEKEGSHYCGQTLLKYDPSILDRLTGAHSVTVELEKYTQPIPLIVNYISDKTDPEVLVRGNGVAKLDVIKCDWLPPLGKGEQADIVFRRLPREDLGEIRAVTGKMEKLYRDVLRVEFPGEGNGLQAMSVSSEEGLRIREAPAEGYKPVYETERRLDAEFQFRRTEDLKRHFSFRIRTRKNEKGEIVEAYYGKIYRDIRFTGTMADPIQSLWMNYYVNPKSLERNLEWDRKTNRCPNPDRADYIGPKRP